MKKRKKIHYSNHTPEFTINLGITAPVHVFWMVRKLLYNSMYIYFSRILLMGKMI